MYSTIKVYQVKDGKDYRDYRFTDYELLKKLDLEIDFNNYDLVFDGTMPKDESVYDALEKAFRVFNVDHPVGYTGRSMSVSDIVQIDNNYYFCDSFGWKELKKKVSFIVE